MGLPVEIDPLLLASKTSAYSVSKSLRFRSSASAYLNRTPASAGSQTTWTWSTWVKRGTLGTRQFITMSGLNPGPSQVFQVEFDANNKLSFYNQAIGVFRLTTAVYRDVGAWYHIVFVADTSNATAQSRFRVWVNGVEITVWDTNSTISSSYAFAYNGAYLHGIGAYTYNGNVFSLDGYMAEVNFIDGQALTPSSFGTYDTNGVWQPIKYSGTYGTNGFYLTFGNTTSTTTLGYDTSGNSNNWTTNNISLTAGSTYDSMTDSPTVSSATVANYATWNAINNSTTNSYTFSNGNLNATVSTTSGGRGITSTSGMTSTSGFKYYAELTVSAWGGSFNADVGILNTTTTVMTTGSFAFSGCIGTYLSNGYSINKGGNVYNNGTSLASSLTTFVDGDIVQIAYDGTYIYFGKNGTWLNSAVPASGTGGYSVAAGTYAFAFGVTSNTAQTGTVIGNFGQQPFTYTPPTGFKALNTYNLPTPTIANGAQYMAATLYTGTGATQTISDGGNNTIGTTFQPDLVWIKSRSAATNNNLFDVLRGTTAYLISNSTATEATNANTLTAFGSTGFTVGSDASAIGVNVNAATYVGWQWKANGAGVTNTNGSITSTVSANTTAGFSIVTYTGTGASNPTIGHGLGVTPNMIILKDRNTNSQNPNWQVYHSSLTSGYFLSLNTTDAQAAISATSYGSVGQPTSTTFKGVAGSVDSTTTNQNTQLYVAYCWAAVSGYSAFGSYTGNGSTDGPFVYTGFRPRWILIRSTSATRSWLIDDTSINPYNTTSIVLAAQSSSGDNTGNALDMLSNGFKPRDTWVNWNASGETFIYAAFAENPFNSSRAR